MIRMINYARAITLVHHEGVFVLESKFKLILIKDPFLYVQQSEDTKLQLG